MGNLGYACFVLGAFAITYALLRRRVLDFEFIVSRTVVVAVVSLIVVAAFTLLEWLLGTVLAGLDKTAGIVANAALAVVLGVSLRAFANEAVFITDPDALLDRAISDIREHTDARSAILFVEAADVFRPARSFGDGTAAAIGPNDGAILALKTWHKSVDPHLCKTSMRGDLAVPMLGRGRLVGALVLGERAGGEAYAADEIEALMVFASGVGSAFDALSSSGEAATIGRTLADIQATLAGLPDAIAARMRTPSA